MKVDIIPIGNSKGIRIPATLLEQCGFGESVEIAIDKKQLILSPVATRRQGWNTQFKKMSQNGDDELLESPPTAFDNTEWSR